MPNRREIWLFQGVNMDEIGWNFHGGIRTTWSTISTGIHSPGPPALWASMQKPCVWVERLLGSMMQQKIEWQGDTLIGKENSSTTARKSQCELRLSLLRSLITPKEDRNSQDLDCLLTLLLSLIRSAKLQRSNCHLPSTAINWQEQELLPMTTIRTVFSLYCWGWSGLPSLDTSESDQPHKAPDCHLLILVMTIWTASRFPDCRRWISFTFQSVTPSLYFCCFTEPSNVSRWLPFDYSSAKMGGLDIDSVYSTLCPSITSTRFTSKFHFNTFQYSVWGAVMLDTITYGHDCIQDE